MFICPENFCLLFLSIRIGDPNVKTEDGETALHIACYYGRSKIVELLVVCLFAWLKSARLRFNF